MEIKEVLSELKALAKALDEKSRVERMKAVGKDEYIQSKIERRKPEKMTLEEPEKKPEIKKTSVVESVVYTCLITFSFFVVCLLCLNLPSIITALLTAGIALLLSYLFKEGNKRYEITMERYNSRCKEIETKNRYYEMCNKNYDKWLEEYNAEYKALEEEFESNQVKLDIVLENAEKEIALHEGIIAPKYYSDIDEIVAILEDGRADTLKEALNVFVSDCNQKKLIDAQKEMNEIAEERMRNEERHNRAMQEEARRQTNLAEQQARMAKEEAEKRKKGAPDCWQCANYPCGGKPEFCGSFRKK